jgi:hypothetical protein
MRRKVPVSTTGVPMASRSDGSIGAKRSSGGTTGAGTGSSSALGSIATWRCAYAVTGGTTESVAGVMPTMSTIAAAAATNAEATFAPVWRWARAGRAGRRSRS